MNEVPILGGAELRELWQEHLTREARRKVRRAVRKGEAVDDPGLAAVAVGLARKYQAQLVPIALASAAILLIWVLILASLLTMSGTEGASLWRLFAVLWIVMVPLRFAVWLLVERPRFRRAEAVNMRRLAEVQ